MQLSKEKDSNNNSNPDNEKPKTYLSAKQNKIRLDMYNTKIQNLSSRRFIQFVNQSNKSEEKIGTIMNSIHNICSTMLFGSKEPLAMNPVSTKASSKTIQLSNVLQKMQSANDKFNRGDLDLYSKSDPKPIKRELTSKTRHKRRISISNLSVVEHEPKLKINEDKTITYNFDQMMRLNKLKGEIMMNDQKKKYAINKTYEPKKHFPEGHFYRKQPSTIKYTPYNSYNKENLYYKKKYYDCITNELNQYERNNMTTYSNIHCTGNDYSNRNSNKYYQCNTSLNQTPTIKEVVVTRKNKVLSSPVEFNISKGRINSSNDYYNTQLPTNRTSHNEDSSSISYAYPIPNTNTSTYTHTHTHTCPKSAITKRNKTQRKLDFTRIKAIHLDVYKQNEELKQAIKDECSKEKPKHKQSKEKEKLEISKIRSEFKLDDIDPVIDEDKLLYSNAEKVSKNLDERSKGFLVRIVKEMMHKDEVLNRKYYNESNFDQKMQSIREKKEMQKVVDQTIALKKTLKDLKAIIPANEKEKMVKMIKKSNQQQWVDEDLLKETLQKCRVMTNIKPLINTTHKKVIKKRLLLK